MRLKGSYTIEAAAVMGIVLMVLSLFFRTAFHWRADTAGAMKLQESIACLRYTQGDAELSFPSYRVTASRKGKMTEGTYRGSRKSLKIEWDRYEPQEFIRMISLIVE